MPTYTYSCNTHRTFTTFKKMSEMQPEEPCPTCGELSPKVMDRTSFVLKGGGWGPRRDPKIPDKFLKYTDAELDEELGLVNDANANA